MNKRIGTGHIGQTRKNSKEIGKRGFTLVELVVVLVISAALVAIAVPAFAGYIEEAKNKEFLSEAEEAVTAAQAALTSLYNEGGNRLTKERKRSVMNLVGIDGSTLDVVTGLPLSWDTDAIPKNIAAYTITWARYSEKGGTGRYAIFDGKAWTLFDDENEMQAWERYSEYTNAWNTSGIKMWSAKWEEVEEGGNQEGSQEGNQEGNTSGYQYDYEGSNEYEEENTGDDYNWDSTVSESQKTVVLHAFGDVDSNNEYHPGLSFTQKEGQTLEDNNLKVTFKFTIPEDGDITWTTDWDGDEAQLDERYFSLKGTGTAVSWATSERATSGETYNEIIHGSITDDNSIISRILASRSSEFHLYPLVEKKIIEKTVKFRAYNEDTLFFGIADKKSEMDITFRKYANEWDQTYDNNEDVVGGRSDMSSLAVNVENPFISDGWVRKSGENNYEMDRIYSDEQDIWELLFLNGSGDTENLILVGNLNKKLSVTLATGTYAGFYEKNQEKPVRKTELLLSLFVSEITGQDIEDDSDFMDKFSQYDFTPARGYRHDGWIASDSSQEITISDSSDISGVRDYVVARALSANSFTFDAIMTAASRAKFICRAGISKHNDKGAAYSSSVANNSDTSQGNFVGQMYDLAENQRGTGNTKLKCFERLDYADGIQFLKDNNLLSRVITAESIGETDVTKYIAKDRTSNGHYLRETPNVSVSNYTSIAHGTITGTVKKLYILWDGHDADNKYTLPIFAFNIVKSSGEIYAFWFTQEPSPELNGGYGNLFMNYEGLDFEASGLDTWNTSECLDFYKMFQYSRGLKSEHVDFSKWEFGKTYSVREMFEYCTNLKTIDLSGKIADECLTGYLMFNGCSELLTADFSNSSFAISKSFANMFANCSKLKSVLLDGCSMPVATSVADFFSNSKNIETFSARGWDLHSATSLTKFFQSKTKLTSVQLGPYKGVAANLSACKDISYMFDGCSSLTSLSFADVNLSNCTNVSSLTSGCSLLKTVSFDRCNMSGYSSAIPDTMINKGVTSFSAREWNLSKATSLAAMFGSDKTNTSVSVGGETLQTNNTLKIEYADFTDADLRSVTSLGNMFRNCSLLKSVVFYGADLRSVTDIHHLCYHCYSLLTLDLRAKDEGEEAFKPVDMSYICDFCIVMNNLKFTDKFVTTQVTTMKNCFYNCRNVPDDQKYFENWDFKNVTNTYHMLHGARFREVTFEGKDMSSLEEANQMFTMSEIGKISFINCKMTNLVTVDKMFQGSSVLREISFSGTIMSPKGTNISGVDTMMSGCTALTTFNAEGWKVYQTDSDGNKIDGATISLNKMFNGVASLQHVDLTNADLSGVNIVTNMFNNCSKLDTVILDGCDMTGLTSFVNNVFGNANQLHTISANNWDVRNVTTFSSAFSGRSGLMYVYMQGIKLNSCTNMSKMFYNCGELLSVNFSTPEDEEISDVTQTGICNCEQMFAYDVKLDAALLNMKFKPSSTKNMFQNNQALRKVDIRGWDFSRNTNMEGMFRECWRLGAESGENDYLRFPSVTDLSNVTTLKNFLYDCRAFTMDTFSNIFATWHLENCPIDFSLAKDANTLIDSNPSGGGNLCFTEQRTYTSGDSENNTYRLGPYNGTDSKMKKLIKVN